MKKLLPSYILSFVISFMLFIFEPITMYSSNIDDLWFDFSMMIFPLIKLFLISFIALSLLFSIIYYIFCKKLKKYKVYYIFLIISFILFIVSYIQGNYLAGNLPGLDGEKIIWSDYDSEALKSIALLLFTCSIMVMVIIKFGYNKVINGIKFVSLGIFAMLSVSLITTLLTTKTLEYRKESFVLTMDNINDASSNKNFFVFLVDAVDSREFIDVVNNSDYKDTFENFTYFPDTMSVYPFTRDSIPYILSGIVNENDKDFSDYSTTAFDESPLFDRLNKLKYDINLYEYELIWNSDEKNQISNVRDVQGKISYIPFYKQELKYLLFKYLPFYLKKYSKIDTMDFKNCRIDNDADYFDWKDSKNYYLLTSNKLNKTDKNIFNFIHIEGGHVPFDIDENFNYTSDGTYPEKLKATLKIVNAFINRLKENNVYDNSIIIIMADHGYNYEEVDGRQNPILYIKGFDEHHEMYTSDKPISYFDLMDAYNDLLENKKSDELFSDIEYPRTRRYIWYEWTKEDHMVEYEQTGKAWETDKMIKTGKEFNR